MAHRPRRSAPLSAPPRGHVSLWFAVVVALIAAASVLWLRRTAPDVTPRSQEPRAAAASATVTDDAATFLGAETCATCHVETAAQWRRSMHAQAMAPASTTSVRAPFSNERFTAHGATSTFSRSQNGFVVRTEGSDGALHDFDVAYTFGVEPLQQYLLPLPGGRYQALSVSWDTRPKSAGGQRWFHLYAQSRVPAGDVLHWTSPSQNWNARCAECHSTNLRKGYDAARNIYKTTWSDINVACEACHGAGSRHVAWARGRNSKGPRASGEDDGLVPLGAKDGATWTFDPGTDIAHRDRPRTSRMEVEMCARCHARRATLTDDYHVGRPITDTHRPSLLEDGLYFADGQIRDEVYEYGSFLQSRMYANGVTCSDCHNPHRPEIASNPDAVCQQCHLPARFATPSHHHHKEDSAGASCVACHMASRMYMTVDVRRDHSFRVPRPDLTVKIGTPNACSSCHANRPASWAATQAASWFGTKRTDVPHYGEALAAGRSAAADAERRLIPAATDPALPAIVRATAVSLLARWLDPQSGPIVERASRDQDPLVRMAAVDVLSTLPPNVRPRALARLLDDPVKAVRIEAARALAATSESALSADDMERRKRGLAEWEAAQRFNDDSASAHVNLGTYYVERGEVARAEAEYRAAQRLEPYFVPAAINLADLYRATNRDADGEKVLRAALQRAPEIPALHHALGLLLVRKHDLPGALDALNRAAELAPDDANVQYTYAVGLYSAGRLADAIARLEQTSQEHPGDRQVLGALVAYLREQGNLVRAEKVASQLVAVSPGDPGAADLLNSIRSTRR
jgi:Flp pilus assembly protein TadD